MTYLITFYTYHSFLRNIEQRAVVVTSSLTDINAWVPQGSTFGTLPFLIYIYTISLSTYEMPSFLQVAFSAVYNLNTPTDEINNDLVTINKWAYQWKMSFNPDSIKQLQEVIFTGKISKEDHPLLFLKQKQCVKSLFTKAVKGIIFDSCLSFEEHLKMILNKVNKTIRLLSKLHLTFYQHLHCSPYKGFLRPHLNFGSIIYPHIYYATFHQKLELTQYNAYLHYHEQ